MTELLKAPEDEQTAGWFMCVPSCFNNALDICLTPRKKAGKELLEWTQGSAFCFKPGDTIYDTPKAYSEWSEALKHLALCIQVQHATEATPAKQIKKDLGGGTVPRDPGVVGFSFLTPNSLKTSLVNRGDAELTQDEFVRLLIKGPNEALKQRVPWKH